MSKIKRIGHIEYQIGFSGGVLYLIIAIVEFKRLHIFIGNSHSKKIEINRLAPIIIAIAAYTLIPFNNEVKIIYPRSVDKYLLKFSCYINLDNYEELLATSR